MCRARSRCSQEFMSGRVRRAGLGAVRRAPWRAAARAQTPALSSAVDLSTLPPPSGELPLRNATAPNAEHAENVDHVDYVFHQYSKSLRTLRAPRLLCDAGHLPVLAPKEGRHVEGRAE